MADEKKTPLDTETILMALDQISQTIQVMTNVVARLKHHMEEQQTAKKRDTVENNIGSYNSQTIH
tara:strand:+ start:1274 stop:1468 length:195 start_codon:yes stop_codon:yes gene_type:complete